MSGASGASEIISKSATARSAALRAKVPRGQVWQEGPREAFVPPRGASGGSFPRSSAFGMAR